MKRVLLVTAALVAAVAVWVIVLLPPRPLSLEAAWRDGSVPGILHIHTSRSDGRSGLDDIAAAAARAGLKFIVFADHGDATREPEPPAYRSGVLCLDGVEISTTGGHYLVLDMAAAPYPLAGEPRDVVEDVRRLGGVGIVAHPDSPKAELAWHDWTLPINGVEILNPDTSWRVHVYRGGWRPKFQLLQAMGTYALRQSETIGSLLTSSSDARDRWALLTTERRVVGIAGVDAHAKLELRAADPGDNRYSLPLPGYEASFRAISVHASPVEALTGDAVIDAARIISAIRGGRVYTAVDAWGGPPNFEFSAASRGVTTAAGGEVSAADDLVLHVRHNGEGVTSSIWRGTALVTGDRGEREFALPVGSVPGAYRVEVRDARHADGPPWITSNPIYVRDPTRAPAAPQPRPSPAGRPGALTSLFDGRSTRGWTLESDATSLSAMDVVPLAGGPELRVRFGLSGGSAAGQFAGVAVTTQDGVAAYDRLSFTIRGERPMRVSVQVRADVPGAPPERWQQSIYIDDTERGRSVLFDDMTPVGATHTPRPPADDVHTVMFIVDTTHTRTGQSGRLWLKDVRLEK